MAGFMADFMAGFIAGPVPGFAGLITVFLVGTVAEEQAAAMERQRELCGKRCGTRCGTRLNEALQLGIGRGHFGADLQAEGGQGVKWDRIQRADTDVACRADRESGRNG